MNGRFRFSIQNNLPQMNFNLPTSGFSGILTFSKESYKSFSKAGVPYCVKSYRFSSLRHFALCWGSEYIIS